MSRSLFNVVTFTVKVVGFDVSRPNPSAVRTNCPVTSFVEPFAFDGRGRLASFSSAKYAASDRSETMVNVSGRPLAAGVCPVLVEPGAAVAWTRSDGMFGALVASVASSRMKNHHPAAAAITTTTASVTPPMRMRGRVGFNRSPQLEWTRDPMIAASAVMRTV